ncbi:MAG: hypothetical protein ABI221_01100 [Candidatus Saccharimonadales bacterium]
MTKLSKNRYLILIAGIIVFILLIVCGFWIKPEWWDRKSNQTPKTQRIKVVGPSELRSSTNDQNQGILNGSNSTSQQKIASEVYFIGGAVGAGDYPAAAKLVESTMQKYPEATQNMSFLVSAVSVYSTLHNRDKQSFYAKIIEKQVAGGAQWPAGTPTDLKNLVEYYAH